MSASLFFRSSPAWFLAAVLFAVAHLPGGTGMLSASEPKRPIGVPEDATFFNGRWYRAYVDGSGWKSAQAKCQRNAGNLAMVPNQETQEFLKKLANGRKLMVGASNERNGVWTWLNGTVIKFQAWERGQPNNVDNREHFLCLGPKGTWYDVAENSDWTQGYICEWLAR